MILIIFAYKVKDSKNINQILYLNKEEFLDQIKKRRWKALLQDEWIRLRLKNFKNINYYNFFSSLRDLISAGFDLKKSLKIIEDTTSNEYFRYISYSLSKLLEEGKSLSQSFKDLGLFPSYLSSSIRIAELSGNISECLTSLSLYYKEAGDIKKSLKKNLTYPLFLLLFSFIILLLSFILLMPIFKNIFWDYGVSLPKSTRLVLGIGNYLRLNFVKIISLAYILLKIGQLLIRKYKYYYDRFKLKNKYLSRFYLNLEFINFFNAQNLMLSSGMNYRTILSELINESHNLYFKNVLEKIKYEIGKGESLHKSMDKTNIFPKYIISILRIGEVTGNLNEQFSKLYKYYSLSTISYIESFIKKLEIFVLIGVGIFILFLVMSLSLPIVNFMEELI